MDSSLRVTRYYIFFLCQVPPFYTRFQEGRRVLWICVDQRSMLQGEFGVADAINYILLNQHQQLRRVLLCPSISLSVRLSVRMKTQISETIKARTSIYDSGKFGCNLIITTEVIYKNKIEGYWFLSRSLQSMQYKIRWK